MGLVNTGGDLVVDFSDSGDFLNFCDDFLGGGLGGKGESRLCFFFFAALASFSPLSAPFTVEFDEEEVRDSRKDGSPWGSITGPEVSGSLERLPVLRRVIGGRFCAGLP